MPTNVTVTEFTRSVRYTGKWSIAFKCWIDNDWHRIGYVVREALDSVHDPQDSGNIIEVKLSWVKYLMIWMRSGPGYNITRVGQWSTEVHHCASTR